MRWRCEGRLKNAIGWCGITSSTVVRRYKILASEYATMTTQTIDARFRMLYGIVNAAAVANHLFGESKVNESQMTTPINDDVGSLDIAM